jgi:tricorn protease
MKLTIACFLFVMSLYGHAQPLILAPSINPEGNLIAFSFQGDIWTVSTQGGRADRLTIHEGYESNPYWSPDGQLIYFESDRFGNADIFVIPSSGGTPKRLTFHSASDRLTHVATDRVLFTTARVYKEVERESEIYSINTYGGTPIRYMDALGFDATLSPDGNKVAFVRGTCRVSREGYRGPANRDIWILDKETGSYTQLTKFEGNEFSPDWLDNNTLVFISPKSGKYNLHKITLEGEEVQLTSETEFGVNSFSLSAQSGQVVYQNGDRVKLLDLSDSSTTEVSIDVASDFRFDPVVSKKVSNMVEEYAVSPDGEYTAYAHHGELFITRNDKEDSRTVRLTNTPARERNPVWLNDETLLFTSDDKGQYDIYAIRSASDVKNLFKTFKQDIIALTKSDADEFDPVVSPDGKKISFRQGRGRLVVSSIDESLKLSNQIVLQDGWDEPEGVSWSPDSKWLAYNLSDLNFNSEVYIHAADNSKKPVNVSMHPKGDYDPIWSPDGSKLGFVSSRNNGDYDVWFAWLKEEDYQRSKEEWKRQEQEGSDDDEKDEDDEEVKVEIDFDGIYKRLVQVTNFAGNESSFTFSPDGDWIYYALGSSGRQNYKQDRNLYKIKWNGEDKEEIIGDNKQPSNLTLTQDGKYLFANTKGGKLTRIKIKDDKSESLPVTAQFDINYEEERNQIFEEGWRSLRDGFYDPNFHGRDWSGLKGKYKPLAQKASTKEDFQYIFNLMLGQLDASHMGMYRGDNPKNTQKQISGLLGIEGMPVNGGLKVTYVLPGSPASRNESKLMVNDIITAVDQISVDENLNFNELLLDKVDQPVLLTIKRGKDTGKEVIIWPVKSLSSELYEDWVETRRKLVDNYSDGKLGYLHIRGMNWTSFERFERELMAAGDGKDGIVIDVRYNGGGWTTDYLMAVLTVRQHAYTIPRGAAENLQEEHLKFKNTYPFSERLPLASWTKPSIALCNENSYSNAEIFSHAFKTLDLGTLVGQPTFGAVISTGGEIMVDGSLVRMPFRGWYVKATEENMENGPAVPDILVENPPAYKAKNIDPQLKRAVDELLNQL